MRRCVFLFEIVGYDSYFIHNSSWNGFAKWNRLVDTRVRRFRFLVALVFCSALLFLTVCNISHDKNSDDSGNIDILDRDATSLVPDSETYSINIAIVVYVTHNLLSSLKVGV